MFAITVFLFSLFFLKKKPFLIMVFGFFFVVASYFLQIETFGVFHTGSDSKNYIDYFYSDLQVNGKSKFDNFRSVYFLSSWPFTSYYTAFLFYSASVYVSWLSILLYCVKNRLLVDQIGVAIFVLSAIWMASHIYRDVFIGLGILASGLLLTKPKIPWALWFLTLISLSVYLRPELLYIFLLAFSVSVAFYILKKKKAFYLVGFFLFIPALLFFIRDLDWKYLILRILITENISEVTAFSNSVRSIEGFGWIKEIVTRFLSRFHTIFLGDSPLVLAYNNEYGPVFRNSLLLAIHCLLSITTVFFGWPLIFSRLSLKNVSFFGFYIYSFFAIYVTINVVKWSGVQARLFIPAFCLLLLASQDLRKDVFRYKLFFILFGTAYVFYSALWFFRNI